MNIKKTNRYEILDQMRGFAVLLMIIFHFCYDLTLFKFLDIDFSNDYFWWFLPRVIVFLFLFSMGQSLRIAHFPKVRKQKLLKRFLQISSLAAIITTSTYFLFPTRWIYFGTLHCIALCLLLLIPFLKFPRVSLVLGLALVIPSMFDYSLPWIKLQHLSMDYIPLFPWIGVGMLGIFMHEKKLHLKKPLPGQFGSFLEVLGKKSLLIYVIHQPILFSLVYIFSRITDL